MRRAVGKLLVLGGLVGCAAQGEWKELPSGDRVLIKAIGQFMVPGEFPVLRLRYQTSVNLSDTVAVRNQALEVWPLLKDLANAGQFRLAALAVESRRRSLCPGLLKLCVIHQYGLLFERDSTGSWHEYRK